MGISKDELLDFVNGIKELVVENGRLKHNNEKSAEYIKMLEEENRKLKYEYPYSLETAEVEAIPIKWIKRYWDSHRVDDMTIWNMLRTWEKENDGL